MRIVLARIVYGGTTPRCSITDGRIIDQEGSWFKGCPPPFLPENLFWGPLNASLFSSESVGYVPKFSGHSKGSPTQVELISIRTARKRDQPTWRARWLWASARCGSNANVLHEPPDSGRHFYFGHLMPISLGAMGMTPSKQSSTKPAIRAVYSARA
jgi:hypothetical protein